MYACIYMNECEYHSPLLLAWNSICVLQTVYDKDTLGADDPMGTAEIDLKPYLEAARLRKELQELPNGCALKKVQPSGTNDLADESRILWENGRITQDMRLKLRNVESGEVLIQIEWVDIPGCKGLDPDF